MCQYIILKLGNKKEILLTDNRLTIKPMINSAICFCQDLTNQPNRPYNGVPHKLHN